MTPIEFILEYAPCVKRACKGTGLFPSVCLAQAALETGWGKAAIGNNMFGIKAKGAPNEYWKGCSKIVTTTEYIRGVKKTTQLSFRTYDTVEDSIRDHNRLLLTSKRYAKVLTASSPEEQAAALQSAGYATDPNYAGKLISIIKTHNLKQFDN